MSSVDEYVMTNPLMVNNGQTTLNIALNAQTNIATSHFEEEQLEQLYGGSFSASSTFDNTATLVEVFGYDSGGARVALSGVSSSSGFFYVDAAVTAVPEPETLLMMSVGLLAVFGAAVRQRSKTMRASSTT